MVKMGANNVQSEDDIQGSSRPLPGQYHAIVKEAKETEFKKKNDEYADVVEFEFECVAGTTPGQENTVLSERFWLSEKAMPRLQRMAIVLGLLKPGEEEKDIEFSDAIGRELIIEVEGGTYEKDGKTVEKVDLAYMGFWSMKNEAVKDVPTNAEVSKLIASGEAPQSPASEPAGTSAGSGNDDKWADL